MVKNMSKFIKVTMSCLLMALITGCNVREENNITNTEFSTQENNITNTEFSKQERVSKEEHPVLSEGSIACIAEGLDSVDNDKYARYIAEYLYLAEIPIDAIINAKEVANNDGKNRIYIEVEDSQNRIYVVVVSEKYSLIGIKENTIDGEWIFTVTQD